VGNIFWGWREWKDNVDLWTRKNMYSPTVEGAARSIFPSGK
jgi:hypothetical protein